MIISLILAFFAAVATGTVIGAIGTVWTIRNYPERAESFFALLDDRHARKAQAGAERAHPEYHLSCGHAPGDHDIRQVPQSYAEWQAGRSNQEPESADEWSGSWKPGDDSWL